MSVCPKAIEKALEKRKEREHIELCISEGVCPNDASDLIVKEKYENYSLVMCPSCLKHYYCKQGTNLFTYSFFVHSDR